MCEGIDSLEAGDRVPMMRPAEYHSKHDCEATAFEGPSQG